jgi:uncharacterized protein YabN with tetrapyrrole methylase and pyrophosphatase domain
MSHYGKVEFEHAVDEAYQILWRMFKGENNDGCPWDAEQEQKLLNMLNAIDNEMGR